MTPITHWKRPESRDLKILGGALMAKLAATALLMAPSMTLAADGPELEPMPTVDYVDLDRYAGTWYEIATIPAIFEWGCTGTTATYEALDDGNISVVNNCNMFWLGGPERSAVGVASVADTETNAKLKVTFGMAPVAGDYWIIGLDDVDYKWAVVGEPSRNYYWILARRPTIDSDLYEELLDQAADLGYDVSLIEETKQTRR